MRKEGYNPLSGCLPLLLTWPIMIAMFSAMRVIANEQLAMQAFRYLAGEEQIVTAAERFLWVKNIWMTDSFFTPVVPTAQALNQLTADVWQKAYNLLSEGQVQAIAQNIALVSENALDFGASTYQASVQSIITALGQVPAYVAAVEPVKGWEGLNFFLFSVTLYQQFNGILLLPILAGVSQVLQYKFNPAMQDQNQNAANGQAQAQGMGNFMKYFFPILSVFWCLTSNAAFAVYWVASTLIVWIQSVLITKILEKKDKEKAQAVAGEGSVK
ncbi:MAG: YidC/Oxa1 family membrane protein insertase, partial [Clostridia bacterium]|nr:YidC/Oxa1 family membrane protein insertase [Clostridia bacterium]